MLRNLSFSLVLLAAVLGCEPDQLGVAVDVSTINFASFQDPEPGSDFTSMDVYDVDGDIVRFDADNEEMVWMADSLAFDNWDIDGNALDSGFFTVRFGTEDGERRAYFTETDPPNICDIVVNDGRMRIVPTEVPVPQE